MKFLCFFAILLLLCSAEAATKKQWTIMIYGATESDIEEGTLDDLIECSKVGTNSKINMLYQMDFSDASFSKKTAIAGSKSTSATVRGEIRKDSFSIKSNLGEANIGDPALLSSFIDWCVTNYPANHYCLLFHGHSSGVESYYGPTSAYYNARSIAYDDHVSDCLTIEEISSAVSSMQQKHLNGNKFDVIAFASCETAQIENLYAFRNNFNFFVGSETTMMAGITNFEDFCKDLNSNPYITGRGFADKLAERMIATGTFWGTLDVMKVGAISAAFDLSKIEDTLLTMRELCTELLKVDHSKLKFSSLAGLDEKYNRYMDLRRIMLSIYEGNVSFTSASNYAKIKNLAAEMHNKVIGLSISLWTAGKWNRTRVGGMGIYWPLKDRYPSFKSFYRRISYAYLSKWWEFLNYQLLNERATSEELLETLRYVNTQDMNDDNIYELRTALINDIIEMASDSVEYGKILQYINTLPQEERMGFGEIEQRCFNN